MKKLMMVVLGLLAVLVVVLVIVAVVADVKFQAVRGAPAYSHTTVAVPGHSQRIVIVPDRGRDYLLKHILQHTGAPEAAVARLLPHEIAILVDPDLETGETDVLVFVNERRLGPVLADTINALDIGQSVPMVAWDGEGMVRQERGVLAMRGTLTIPEAYRAIAHQEWGRVAPMKPMEIEGGHLFEAVLDNRDGAAFALITTIYPQLATGPLPYDPKALAKSLWNIAAIRVAADLVNDNDIALRITFESNPRATEDDMASLAFLLGTLRAQLDASVSVTISGTSLREDLDVICDWHLGNFTPLIEPYAPGKPEPTPATS